MPKTIVLNQSTLHPEYSLVDAACRVTWGMEEHEHVKIFHYYGNVSSNGNTIEDVFSCVPPKEGICIDKFNRLVQNITDRIDVSAKDKKEDKRGERLIGALEYCLNNFEFDYIYRTTCTSYIDIYKMCDYFNKLEVKEKFYEGTRNMWNYQYLFVTGYHQILSRDVVKVIIEHKDEYLKLKLPEDVAVGALIIDILKYASFENNPPHNTSVSPLNNNDFNLKFFERLT